ncbi:MAG TPA: DUF488 family protein [Aldersonia sp.]
MPEDAVVDTLRRWTAAGATWKVLLRTTSEATVALCRCDGGEEVDRITSGDPSLLAYVANRDSSEQPPHRALRVARVYDPPAPDDGARILVDRLWPRGIRKADAALDDWCKDVAPSTDLRRWYGHRPEVFDEFARRYRAELASPDGHAARAALTRIADRAEHQTVTLLTASRAVDISDAAVLRDVLAELPG